MGWTLLPDPLQRVSTSQFQYNYEDIITRVGSDILWIGVLLSCRKVIYNLT